MGKAEGAACQMPGRLRVSYVLVKNAQGFSPGENDWVALFYKGQLAAGAPAAPVWLACCSRAPRVHVAAVLRVSRCYTMD